MKAIIRIYILLILCYPCFLYAQKANPEAPLINKIQNYHRSHPIEKIYLSFDKPYYSVGDTLWFKSYLLNSDFTSAKNSDKIYVELFDDNAELVERRVILLNNGLGFGDFALTNTLKEGNYTISAYSNWQQNFGAAYFFQKNLYIGKPTDQTWLINADQQLITKDNKKNLKLSLKLNNLKNESIGYRDLSLYLVKDKKRIMSTELSTNSAGFATTSIPLPQEEEISTNFSFLIIDKKEPKNKLTFPVIVNDSMGVDLQFMPEGGFLVNGLSSKVAFKAIGTNGLGLAIKGEILNSKKEQVATFASQHKGMGNFNLYPQKGEEYFASFESNGTKRSVKLPAAKEEGITLKVNHLIDTSAVVINIKASPLKRTAGNYELVMQTADSVILALKFQLTEGFYNVKIPKAKFPAGIVHFTLFSPDHFPINERIIFIEPNQKINISLSTVTKEFSPRDSINLAVQATTEQGHPLAGAFSVTVTSDAQVKQTTNQANIATHFLLQSDLKGHVEDIGWYFRDNEPATLQAIDNLVLAQGWIGYNWDNILSKIETPKFKAEKDNTIEGKITQMFNKPAVNNTVNLLSTGKLIFMADTLSNNLGEFSFKNLPLIDTAAFLIKVKNAKGKAPSVTINVQEFVPSPFTLQSSSAVSPWYFNADSSLLNYYKTIQNLVPLKERIKPKADGITLNEVEIKAKNNIAKFNQKFAWDADPFAKIDEEQLKKTPGKSLLDLLKEKLPGLTISTFWTNACSGSAAKYTRHSFKNYVVGTALISHVVIDNINTHLVSCGMDDGYKETGVSSTAIESDVFFTNQQIFETLSAVDIKEINIYKGCVYYFLDIKTRTGSGPWVNKTEGAYVYRPLPVYNSKDFYSPRYSVVNNKSIPDLRSTIFWDANLVTNQDGKTNVSFFAADQPGTYTVKIEGTDMLGRFGYAESKITIKGGKITDKNASP